MKPRIIIVEGPDNCGKSTLAREIARVHRAVYWHMTCGKGLDNHDAMRLYQKNALDNAIVAISNGQSVVFDRHWPSDQVYGTVLRGEPSIEYGAFRSMIPDALYIFCERENADSAVKAHAANQDPDHPYDEVQYRKIYRGYRTLRLELEIDRFKVVGFQLENFIDRPNQMQAFIEGLSNIA